MSGSLNVADRGHVRVLTMSRPKVNALDPAFVAELLAAVQDARDNRAVGALVLTSAFPKVFSAGLDLTVLSTVERPAFEPFVVDLEDLVFELYRFPRPLVCALTGHALAGGAILAGTADVRFAAEGGASGGSAGTIGLPEVRLGVVLPRFFLEAFRATFGERALSRWALSGEASTFAEARELGAIDRLVPAETLLEESVAHAARLAELDGTIYAAIKRDLRAPATERAERVREQGRREFVDSWFAESGRKGRAAQLARLAR